MGFWLGIRGFWAEERFWGILGWAEWRGTGVRARTGRPQYLELDTLSP